MSSLPKIALVGYGTMGKEIERLARLESIKITNIFDEYKPLTENQDYQFDVAIDFTVPDAVFKNVDILTKLRKNIVIGTTGWYDNLDLVKDMAEKRSAGVVWGSNFSVGMQIFYKIADYSSQLFNKVEGYDVFLHEIHHKRKKDSPSGTAITLSDIILKNTDSKNEKLISTPTSRIGTNELHVSSTRGGEVPGTHTIYYDSSDDTIEMTHRARNRTGFAHGALLAAKLIHKKKKFYEFGDLLKELWVGL
jgi:4-hydroxy-tetrahydrodipicolinate reductase